MMRRAGSGSSTGGVSVDGSVASDRTLLENERGARAELRSALDDLLDAEVDAGIRPGVRRIWWVLVGLVVIGAVVAAGVGVAAWVRAAHAYTDDDYRHTATEVAGDWSHPYSREQAVFPLPWLKAAKVWPAFITAPRR